MIPTQVKGFKFAGIRSGIKEKSKKLDLALIFSQTPCAVAGSFTTNRAKAAPVLLGLKTIPSGKGQAVIINSGNANACTGALGLRNAKKMIEATAKALNLSSDLVFVASTGKIGIQLPMEKILQGIPEAVECLSDSQDSLSLAAQSILTTDQFAKIHGVRGKIKNKPYTIVGFAKGAGMIEPAMKPASSSLHATMLGFIMTDAAIPAKLLQEMLDRIVETTFNRITVDGDMSTNDTALLLANGCAENEPLSAGSAEAKKFEKNLKEVCETLALKMVEDGEGATKVVKILIKGAKNEEDARKIAYSVGRSELVKTSFFGQDPNWGRLLAAVGYSRATVDPSKVDIYYGSVRVASRGMATNAEAEHKAHEVMKAPRFTVTIHLKQGKSGFELWTSDLNYDYVKLNAEYRT